MVTVTTCAVPSTVVDREAVGQRVADIERLHCGVAVVDRVGPRAGGVDGVGAVAVAAPRRRPPEGVGRVVDVGELSPAAVGVPGAPLATPPASVSVPGGAPRITAASFAPLMVMFTVFAVPSTAWRRTCRSASRRRSAPSPRRCCRSRVGPCAGSIDRDRAIAVACAGAPIAVQRVRRVVDVAALRFPVATRCPACRWDAAGLGHRPGDVAGDHRGVVGAVDGDGDQLRGAVDGGDGEASVSVSPTLSACTSGLLLSSV